MLTVEELAPLGETLLAEDYRRLWLADAHELGLIAETLADVLGWQPTTDELLPDALALAGEAVDRIATLEAMLVVMHSLRAPQNISSTLLTISIN